jgi:Ser/Thr protein kinase RdoA (MazF antagonist)
MNRFASLNDEQRVERLHQLARLALRAYDFPEAKLTPLSFVNNATFKVETAFTQANASTYVLRIHRPQYRTSAHIRSELQYLQALKKNTQIVLPEPVPTREGELLTTVELEGIDEPRHCDLLTWVEGRVCRPHQGLGLKGTYQLGELLGRMHLFAHSFEPPAEFCLPRWDADALFTEASPFKPGPLDAIFSPVDRALFHEVERRTREIFRILEHEPQAFGILHFDFILGNCLFHKREARVVDFGDCGWGYFLYDLCPLLGNLHDYPEYPALRRAFVAGYSTMRPFPKAWEEAFDVLMAARHASQCLWIAGCQGGGGKVPSVEEHIAYRLEEVRSLLKRT